MVSKPIIYSAQSINAASKSLTTTLICVQLVEPASSLSMATQRTAYLIGKPQGLSPVAPEMMASNVLPQERGTCWVLWLLTSPTPTHPCPSHPPCPPGPKRETSVVVFISLQKWCFSDSIKAQLILKLNEKKRWTSDRAAELPEPPAGPGHSTVNLRKQIWISFSKSNHYLLENAKIIKALHQKRRKKI